MKNILLLATLLIFFVFSAAAQKPVTSPSDKSLKKTETTKSSQSTLKKDSQTKSLQKTSDTKQQPATTGKTLDGKEAGKKTEGRKKEMKTLKKDDKGLTPATGTTSTIQSDSPGRK